MKTLTINHDRVLNHWLALNKGDSISFRYQYSWCSKRTRPTDYIGTVSANRRKSFEKSKTGLHTNISGLFECVDIDTSNCETFKDYFKLLKKVFNDPSIGYIDIYKKEE
jgi:hypothetical protein